VDRLRRQFDFILEVDRAKQILRRSRITGGDRFENDGEHMWHVALAAMVLGEHADDSVDVGRVVRMLLVHDIVEIDAGDAFLYDVEGRAAKEEAETAAADRIFAILPDDQRDEFRALWEEFEAKATPEARFATAVDRILPMLLNHATSGSTWQEFAITSDRVIDVNLGAIGLSSAVLTEFARELIEDSVAKGFLAAP
jgi:putative hydrolase of HD superfamily